MTDATPLNILQFTSARSVDYGAAKSMLTLSTAMKARGHKLTFGTFTGRPLGSELRSLGFEVTEFTNRTKLDPVLIATLRRHLLTHKIDLLHVHLNTSALNGIIAARLARVPSVATVHGMSFKVPYGYATRVIAVSEACRRHLLAQHVPDSRISVVYNGLDLQPFQDLNRVPESKLQFGFPIDSFVVGTTARATKMKGIQFVLQALALKRDTMPQARYLFVGDGSDLEEFKAMSAELKIEDRVSFTGYQTDVRPALQAMDLFAFPSLKEAMGISLVEAMATGLPVVSTTVGGIPEVVQNGATGLLVAPGDADALANAIEVFARDRDLCSKMGAKGRERVQEHFTAEAMGATMEKVYRETIAAYGAPQRATAPA